MTKCALGIDIGGTNTKLGLVLDSGKVLEHQSFKTEAFPDPQDYFIELVKRIDQVMTFYQSSSWFKSHPLVGIGVGAPNANFKTGEIEAPINIPWGNVPLQKWLVDKYHLPVVLDNDANAAALGEYHFGLGQEIDNFILVTLGTGVGTGLFSQGRILRSAPGKAGEGGHIVIIRDGRPCNCGGFGHLESYCSSRGVKQTALEIMGEHLATREISQRFSNHDPLAIKVVDFTAECLGFGLAQMCALLNPTLIIIGGGVSQLSPDLAERTERWLKHYTFRAIRHDAQIKISQLQSTQGSVLGAATLVF